MMKKSNSETFGYYLNKYLTVYLPGQRGLSTNSILSYRDTFSLLIVFLKTEKQITPEKLSMSFLTKKLIIEFADWLETNRKCSLTSRNQRFVVIRSFCRWLSTENPEFLRLSEEIYAVKLKKAPKPVMTYLSAEAMKCLLTQPDSSKNEGLRDLTLLAFTYDTGARVSEITDLKFKDIRFEAPPIVKITGKGNKTRIVPLLPQTMNYLKEYMKRWKINLADAQEQYVFTNRSGGKLSRSGIKYILDKYVEEGRTENPLLFPEKISPHTLRHTKAMHMLQAGNNIVYIRDILGHYDLNTTERYARADTALKREALSKAEIPMPEPADPLPEVSPDFSGHSVEDDMANWLKNFSKK
ncbi:MAG: tyrosine-type recombinase/integrase [Dethiobacter sp.]|jgi:site-specific recombinase XerD|nr:tyrosine-type recombinase/integrase [Dethiobacter sp.]MBS3989454.1 tyrosine-type recombinase/integrase [Dethiobacter sp.]